MSRDLNDEKFNGNSLPQNLMFFSQNRASTTVPHETVNSDVEREEINLSIQEIKAAISRMDREEARNRSEFRNAIIELRRQLNKLLARSEDPLIKGELSQLKNRLEILEKNERNSRLKSIGVYLAVGGIFAVITYKIYSHGAEPSNSGIGTKVYNIAAPFSVLKFS